MSASEVLVSSRIVSIRPALVALVISLAVGPPRVLVFVVVINCIICISIMQFLNMFYLIISCALDVFDLNRRRLYL